MAADHDDPATEVMGRAVPPTAPMPAAGAGAGGPDYAAPGPTPQQQQVMTQMAGAAMNMSQIFEASFQRAVPGWRGQLSEPVGPSTGGGERAQQPISLLSQRGERLAVGRVDAPRKTASIRSYDVVSAMCQQRYGRPFDASREDYQRFADTMSRLFRSFGLEVTHDTHYVVPSQGPAVVASKEDGNKTLTIVLVGVIVVLLVVIAVLALR